jgi:ATP-dependent Lhr-like helicase
VLDRAAREVDHVRLDRISPLSVPVLSMIGRESLPAGTADDMLLEEAETLAAAAMRPDSSEVRGEDD